VRTAFEFARLLYALDPWADPHGALLHLDLLALKAGMGSWLLEVYDWVAQGHERRQTERMGGRMDPSVLPGWAYARALALRMGEDTQKDNVSVALFFRVPRDNEGMFRNIERARRR
jgi:hypothetical protein